MSSPTWNEYLRDAKRHVTEARDAMEAGSSPPLPPVRPNSVIPAEFIDEAKILAASYDELALEVAERMRDLKVQMQQNPKSPHQDQAPATYIDTSA